MEATRSRRSLLPQSRRIRLGEAVARSTTEEDGDDEEEREEKEAQEEEEEEGEEEGGASSPCPGKDHDLERVSTATCDAQFITIASGRAL